MLWTRLEGKPTGRLRQQRGKLPPRPSFIGSPRRYHRRHFRGKDGVRYAHVVEMEKAYQARLKRFSLGSQDGSRATAAPRHDYWYKLGAK